MHERTWKQDIFQSYNIYAMPFDKIPFTCQVQKRRQKRLRVSNLALLWVVYKWHHGSEDVKENAGTIQKHQHNFQGKLLF